ncbi:acyltransferase [Streptomyces longisporus]|uniref:Acyltransferase 3 domain-containing protein n=1 Tax=Streptomyces longisporus TaxID=1948 RepID=A0ABN3LXQ9_STRLO
MSRDRYVDFLRAWAIVLVVLGHWLITALLHGPGGELTAPELLASVPWTQWLTLLFQIMPLFFLAGGHAAAGSWARTRSAGGTATGWVGRRAVRLLLPTTLYSGLVLLAVGVCSAVGVDPGTLALVGWAMAMQFWFLPVYLLLSALTPALHAAHRRWGLAVPLAMGAVALIADTVVLTGHASHVGLLNYVLVWGVAYQLGFCRHDGLLTERRPLLPAALAAGGGLAFAVLVALGPFPVSLILVTGQTPSNTNPPSAAMLCWAVAQVGACLLAAPVLRRVLQRERVWRVVRSVGGVSMTLYLWHMLPVLVVAAAFYLTGLAPEPALGSAAWWALRVPWLLVLGVVLVAVVSAVQRWEGGLVKRYERIRPDAGPYRPWLLWPGLAVCATALSRFATRGFTTDGRFPALPALALAVGAALVLIHRRPTEPSSTERAKGDALEEAA